MRLPTALLTLAAALVFFVSPVLAEAPQIDTTIEDNGAGSFNAASTVVVDKTKVGQTNVTNTQTAIFIEQESGDNKISGTTGGSPSIESGKLKTEVTVSNLTGYNQAEVDPCGCPQPDVTTEIKNNGVWSKNFAFTYVKSKTKVEQTNVTNIGNVLGLESDSGDNKIYGTTNGNPSIKTGKSKVQVTITNQSGANYLL